MSRVYGSATANAALDSAEAGCSVVDKAAIRRSLIILALSDSTFLDNSKMAEKSDCIIVGRCADYVLQDLNPFRLFVYADISSKIARCREKGADAAAMTDKELQQKIISIDKKRARYYQFYTEQDWGNKANYDLCINTTNTEIKKIVAAIEKFIV